MIVGELIPKEDVDELRRAAGELARAHAYEQVLELLDREIAKAKDNGDLDTAEVFELIRAKVKAHSDKV
jgi:thioesterase domain-containing protein